MKRHFLLLAPLALVSCDRAEKSAPQKKVESVSDIQPPKNVGPPVQANSYDDGYKAGDLAGLAAAKAQKENAPKTKPALPAAQELDVLALQAAGTDLARGQKWQRGYAAGFQDGFVREAEGRR